MILSWLTKLAEIYDKPWALTAPAAILLLTREHVSYRGNSYHIHDYSAAAENILLAAVDKGYATTWIEGQIEGEKARQMGDLLGVPQDLTVAIYMPWASPPRRTPALQKCPLRTARG